MENIEDPPTPRCGYSSVQPSWNFAPPGCDCAESPRRDTINSVALVQSTQTEFGFFAKVMQVLIVSAKVQKKLPLEQVTATYVVTDGAGVRIQMERPHHEE